MMPMCLYDDSDGPDTRGWVMRHGHCHQLKCHNANTSVRGRTAFARSVGNRRRGNRSRDFEEERNITEQPRRKDRSLAQKRRKGWWPKYDSHDDVLQQDDASEAADLLGWSCETFWPKLWEEAEAKATDAAKAYADQASGAMLACDVRVRSAAPRPAAAPPTISIATPFAEPPPGAGQPYYEHGHDRVAALASPGPNGKPCCWTGKVARNSVSSHVLPNGSSEYCAVTDYLQHTLNMAGVSIKDCTRLQNDKVYSQYSSRGGETIMFHGCRTAANEANIMQEGFQVSVCTSGGRGFGTWFAYGARYSSNGYAAVERVQDEPSLKHLFVCVVSYKHTVKDDSVMRVVGQGCAYPLWLVRYAEPVHQRPTKKSNAQRPQRFFVVRDGEWVIEDSKK